MSKKVRFYLIISVIFSIISSVLITMFLHRDKVIATVNQEEIYESELEMSMKSATPMLSIRESRVIEDTTINKQIKKKALEKLIHKKLVLQEAKKEKFNLSPKQAEKAVQQLENSFQTKSEFHEVLQKYNLSEKDLEEKVREELIVSSFLEEKLGASQLKKQELEEFLKQLKKKNKITIYL